MRKDLLENMRKFFRYVSEADEPEDSDIPDPMDAETDDAEVGDKEVAGDEPEVVKRARGPAPKVLSHLDDEDKQLLADINSSAFNPKSDEHQTALKDATLHFYKKYINSPNKALSTFAKETHKQMVLGNPSGLQKIAARTHNPAQGISLSDASFDDETKQAIKDYHKALAGTDETAKEHAFRKASEKLLTTVAKSSDKDASDWAGGAFANRKTAADALRDVYDPKSDKFDFGHIVSRSKAGKRHGGVDKQDPQARMKSLQGSSKEGESFDIAGGERGAGGQKNTGDIKTTGARIVDRSTHKTAAKQQVTGVPQHEFDKLVRLIPGDEKAKTKHLKRVLRVFAGYEPGTKEEKELGKKLSSYYASAIKRVTADTPGVQKSLVGQGGNILTDPKQRATAIAGSIFTHQKDPVTGKLKMAIRDLAAHTSKNPTKADIAELVRRVSAQVPRKATPEQRKLLQPRASKEAKADDLVSPEMRLGLGSVDPHPKGPSQLTKSKQIHGTVGISSHSTKEGEPLKGFVGAVDQSISDASAPKGLIGRSNMRALSGAPSVERAAPPVPEVAPAKEKHGIKLPEDPEHSTDVENALDIVAKEGNKQPTDLSKIVSWRRAQNVLNQHKIDMSKFKPETPKQESVLFNKIFNESVHKALARLEALLG